MVNILRRLRINEVSSVDAGAGEGVKIMLMKRTFSARERQREAKSGAAEADGSYPIENKTDLHNAMRAIGRSKNPAKTRAHIRARARALGLEGELSDAFKREPMGIFSKFFGRETPSVAIDKAVSGLSESVASILKDDGLDEVGAADALDKSFEQFGDHLKETLAAGGAVEKKEGESEMDLATLRKALGLPDTATEADVTKKLADQSTAMVKMQRELDLTKADFTPEELAFYKADGASYDDEENDRMGDGDPKGGGKPNRRKAFRLASHEERAKMMKAATPAVPEYVAKAMAENEDLKKRLAALEAGNELVMLNKRASEHDLPEAEGETLQKAYRGDKAAIDKLLGFIKQANAAAKSAGVFKEFGTSLGGGKPENAYEELKQKANDLKKADPNLSFEKAFEKVYSDPANIEIVKRERAENRPSAT